MADRTVFQVEAALDLFENRMFPGGEVLPKERWHVYGKLSITYRQ